MKNRPSELLTPSKLMARMFTPIAVLAVAGLSSSTAAACTACMGDPSSKVAGAINGAIFFMLGAIGLMLGLLGCFAVYLMRRAALPEPPHVTLSREDTEPDERS